MKDRTNTQVTARQTCPPSTTALPVAPPAQQEEFLRRARIATAQAAVNATAKRLAGTYLPSDERWALAREHETNLQRLAVLRVEAGTATLNDHRLLNPDAANAAEYRFWASDDSWEAASSRLTADLAAINQNRAQA